MPIIAQLRRERERRIERGGYTSAALREAFLIQVMVVPGANKEGFIALDALRHEAKGRSLEEFARAYPAPALLILDVAVGAPGPEADATARPGPQLVTMLDKHASVFRYMDAAGFLVKRPGNPFPKFVSLGRSPNNDLVVNVDSVSKFHAYFTCDERGTWSVTDYRSTNGTEVNGLPAPANVAHPLADGDTLRLARLVKAVYLTTAGLHERLRAGR